MRRARAVQEQQWRNHQQRCVAGPPPSFPKTSHLPLLWSVGVGVAPGGGRHLNGRQQLYKAASQHCKAAAVAAGRVGGRNRVHAGGGGSGSKARHRRCSTPARQHTLGDQQAGLESPHPTWPPHGPLKSRCRPGLQGSHGTGRAPQQHCWSTLAVRFGCRRVVESAGTHRPPHPEALPVSTAPSSRACLMCSNRTTASMGKERGPLQGGAGSVAAVLGAQGGRGRPPGEVHARLRIPGARRHSLNRSNQVKAGLQPAHL